MRKSHVVLLFALALVASGCSLVGSEEEKDVVCTLELRPGIVVDVTNAATGEPVETGAVGYARDGAFVDTLEGVYSEAADETELFGAHERGGTYDVRVEKEGFETWTREGVEVEEGVCHVKTVELKAELTPVD